MHSKTGRTKTWTKIVDFGLWILDCGLDPVYYRIFISFDTCLSVEYYDERQLLCRHCNRAQAVELKMSQMITIDSNSDLEMYAVEADDSRLTQPVEILPSDFEEDNFDLLRHASVPPR